MPRFFALGMGRTAYIADTVFAFAFGYTFSMSVVLSENPVRVALPTPKFSPRPRHTAAEYLAIDDAAERRSEFIEGEIVLMAGASDPHIQIVTNFVRLLGERTEDEDCFVFSNDARVQAAVGYYYPDVGVVCGERLKNTTNNALTNPAVIIEVLSDSTENVDRGVKLRHYRRLPSLRTYLLVSQDYALVEQYERIGDATEWRILETEGLDATVELPALDCRLPMSAIYRRVSVTDYPDDIAGDDAPLSDEPAG